MKWRLISAANTRLRRIAFALVLAPSVLVQGYRQDVNLQEVVKLLARLSRDLAAAQPRVSVYQVLRARKQLLLLTTSDIS